MPRTFLCGGGKINAQRVWGSFKMHSVAMSARNDSICLECLPCLGKPKCRRGGVWQPGSVCNLRTVVDCSGSSSSKSNSMYSRRHKNAKLYFTFTLSHQRLCCQKGKREKGSFFFSFLLSSSLLSAFLSLLAVCVGVFFGLM